MTIDIQGIIDSITSDDYPAWTVLLGVGAYNKSNLLDESEFYDLVIDDKSNSIPTATIVFVNKTEDDLQDVAIRCYLDGEKKFTGKIKKCSKAYMTNQVSCTCLGIAAEIQDEFIKEKQDIRNTKSSEIIQTYLVPTGWTVVINTSENDFIVNYRLESGNFLQHINNICVQNYWEWWVEETDSLTTISTRKLKIASWRGIETPQATFTLEKSAYEAIIEKDKEKLKNTVLVSGSSSQASNTSTTAAGFFTMGDENTATAMGYVIGSESYLAEPVVIGDTIITLEDVSGYQDTGTIQIDDEQLDYTARDATGNTLTIEAATVAHDPDTPVLMISLMRAYVPASVTGSGKVWIGNELLSYGSADSTGLHNLTRGEEYDGEETPAYAHGDGTKIFNGNNSLSAPADDSSIGTWGQADSRVSQIGSTDRDGLDKYGTSILLNSMKYEQFGSFNSTVDELNGLEIGDEFYLQEYGSDDKVMRRCMGLKFSGDILTITFGLNEDYILQQFDSVNKIDSSTYVKQDLNKDTEIKEVSSDRKSVKIEQEDGTYKWLAIK